VQKKPFSSKSGIFKAPEGELKAPEALPGEGVFCFKQGAGVGRRSRMQNYDAGL